LTVVLITFFEEIEDVTLVLSLEILSVWDHITKLFPLRLGLVDSFIDPFFNTKTKHLDLMKAHVSMRYIKNIASLLFRVSVNHLFLLFTLELIIDHFRFSLNFFYKFLSALESHFDWIVLAHFSNGIDESLLPGALQEAFKVEASN